MIPIFIKNYNNPEVSFLEISEYNSKISNLNPYSIKCSCGCKGNCIKYGGYKRTIDKYTIFIQRVFCKVCKITHSLIPTFMVPYERNSINYILDLVTNTIYDNNSADYELKRYKRNFSEWKNRIKTIGIEISDDINKVITFCAYYFKMCFMQSKIRKNSKLNEVKYFVGELPT